VAGVREITPIPMTLNPLPVWEPLAGQFFFPACKHECGGGAGLKVEHAAPSAAKALLHGVPRGQQENPHGDHHLADTQEATFFGAGSRARRDMQKDAKYKWPNGKIVYEFCQAGQQCVLPAGTSWHTSAFNWQTTNDATFQQRGFDAADDRAIRQRVGNAMDKLEKESVLSFREWRHGDKDFDADFGP